MKLMKKKTTNIKSNETIDCIKDSTGYMIYTLWLYYHDCDIKVSNIN
jgi:hypothetical protein